jgi:signal peptidase I
MQTLASLVLAAFVAYAASWYFGFIEGNFALLLFIATVVSGIFWLVDRFHFLPQRRAAAARVEDPEAKARILEQPWWLDWTAGLFPVIISVFFLRSFVVEPFKIPSGSMIPTLLVGDMILVNKFTYGLRLPVIHTKVTEGKAVQRGDVVVFRYPPKPQLDYIKRVVGLPGDTVTYLNKRLTINGKVIPTEAIPDFFDDQAMVYSKQLEESLGEKKHRLLNDDNRPAFIAGASPFEGREGCQYSVEGVSCKVPAGHYFVMGDNRDNSLDSRYWGFVPDGNIVGKAFMIWMNFSSPRRIGFFD